MGLLYPSDLPLDAVAGIVSIVKSGDLAARKNELCFDVWEFQGFVQHKILPYLPGQPVAPSGGGDSGKPADEGSVVFAGRPLSDAEACEHLEQLVTAGSARAVGTDASILANIPWKQVAVWLAKLLLTAIGG